jgi:F-type H+-transporting ATPase subunit delta
VENMSRNSESYALDLFALAYDDGHVEEIRQELKALIKLFGDEPKVVTIVKNPKMESNEKKGFLQEIVAKEVSVILIDFVVRLIEEENFDLLEDIEFLYNQGVRQYLEDYLGIIEGEVYSAVPLTREQMKKLVHTFEIKCGKEVRFIEVVDPSLIGGYRVKIQSKVYDDTIKLQLSQLRETLEKS